jgi:PAS domain S-box-containing protein
VKIRSQINGLLLIAALVIPCAATLVGLAHTRLNLEMREMAAAENLINSINQIRMIAVETTLFHEARSLDQWQRKMQAMQTEIAAWEKFETGTQNQIQAIRTRLALLQTIFPRLSSSVPENKLDTERNARTIASLFVLTQEIINLGNDLIRTQRNDTERALFFLQLTLGVILLILGTLALLVWHLVRSNILQPLDLLNQGTARIAAGEYGQRLQLRQQNEIGQLGQAFDLMTQRVQQTRDALEQSVLYTRAILAHAADGIFTIDALGAIQSSNPALERIFGQVSTMLVGTHFRNLLTQGSRAEYDAYLTSLQAADNQPRPGRTLTCLHADGHPFPIDLTLSPTVYRGEGLWVGVLRDISEQQRVDRLKSEFVSVVSHELRTPLTSINGSLGLITGGAMGELPPAMRPLLTIAHKNSTRLALLINDLLDFEKLVAGKMRFDLQVMPLMPLINQALEANRGYGNTLSVEFVLASRDDTAQVKVDSERLLQVMANFLSNAAKFSPAGESVEIHVRPDSAGTAVRVEVVDHGPGIPLAFRSRIFEKFSQADASDTRQKSGTGLGLAISKELIEQMQGSIGFESEAGRTCFYFSLPLASPSAMTPSQDQA